MSKSITNSDLIKQVVEGLAVNFTYVVYGERRDEEEKRVETNK